MWFAQTLTTTSIEVTTSDDKGFLAVLASLWIVWFVFIIFYIVAMWKVFEKADEPGWKSIVPILNVYTHFRIAGRNGWWFLGMFVPLLNLVIAIMVSLDMAKHFGKSAAFGIVGLFFFSTIGYLILGYGDSKYVGTKHA